MRKHSISDSVSQMMHSYNCNCKYKDKGLCLYILYSDDYIKNSNLIITFHDFKEVRNYHTPKLSGRQESNADGQFTKPF